MSHFLLNLVRRSAGLAPLGTVEPRLPDPISTDVGISAFGAVNEEVEMEPATTPPQATPVEAPASRRLTRTPPERSVSASTDVTQPLRPASQADSNRDHAEGVTEISFSQITLNQPVVAGPELRVERSTDQFHGPIASPPPASQPASADAATLSPVEVVSPRAPTAPLAATPISHTNIIQRTVESLPVLAPAAPSPPAEPLGTLRAVSAPSPMDHTPASEPMRTIEAEPSVIPQVKTKPATVVEPTPPRLPAIPLVRQQPDQPATRPVYVRIGTIEVQGSPPAPALPTQPAPASSPKAAEGFSDYVGLRTYVSWDRP